MERGESAFPEFDSFSEEISNTTTPEEIDSSTRGNTADDAIDTLDTAEQIKDPQSSCSTMTSKNKRKKNTQSKDQKSKQRYIGGFDYKESEAYKIISKMYPQVNYVFVVSLAKEVIKCEKEHGKELVNWCRESYKSKPGVYRFIQYNIDVFNQYFAAGTNISKD